MDNEEILTELYKTQVERWGRTRVDEWGVTLALWTGIAVLTGFLLQEFKLPNSYWGIYFTVWLLCCVFFRSVSQANTYDKRWADVYLSKLQIKVQIVHQNQSTQFQKVQWWYFLWDWSFWFKAIITFLILCFSWIILS